MEINKPDKTYEHSLVFTFPSYATAFDEPHRAVLSGADQSSRRRTSHWINSSRRPTMDYDTITNADFRCHFRVSLRKQCRPIVNIYYRTLPMIPTLWLSISSTFVCPSLYHLPNPGFNPRPPPGTITLGALPFLAAGTATTAAAKGAT